MKGFDAWLTTDRVREESEARYEAFERWADSAIPGLDWDDADAVLRAGDAFDAYVKEAAMAHEEMMAEAAMEWQWRDYDHEADRMADRDEAFYDSHWD